LFGGSGRPTYLLHLLNFWQLTRSAYMQIGATGLYGTNPDSSLRTRAGGLDCRITWRPPAQALYREGTRRAARYALRREDAAAGPEPGEGRDIADDLRGDRPRDRGRPRERDLDRERRREPALRAAEAELCADAVAGGRVRNNGPRPRALGSCAARQGEQPQGYGRWSGLRGRLRR